MTTSAVIPSSEQYGDLPKTDEFYIDVEGNILVVLSSYADEKGKIILASLPTNRYKYDATLTDFLPDKRGKRKYIRVEHSDIDRLFSESPAQIAQMHQQENAAADGAGSTAVSMAMNSKAQISLYQESVQVMIDQAERISRIVKAKAREIAIMLDKQKSRLSYTQRVLDLFESYLGVYESVVQINEGTAAAYDHPITIVQGIRWMDEEVGDVELREHDEIGITFSSVAVFDEWLVTDNHYKTIIPFEKGIMAFQPSRQLRDYAEVDVWSAMEMRAKNRAIYLLIRNGDNLYRIFTGLSYDECLFPTLAEWAKVMEAVNKADEEGDEEDWMRAKGGEINIRKKVALLQGIFDRMDVLDPKPDRLNLFREEDYESGKIILLRDWETNSLGDGWEPFDKWRTRINESIEVGSRVIIGYVSSNDVDSGQVGLNLRYDSKYFPTPDEGVYEVVEIKEQKRYYYSEKTKMYKILFMPTGQYGKVYSRDKWDEERQRRVSFWIHPNDRYFLNYDNISMEEASYYAGRRIERRQYREILPLLYAIFRARKAELVIEAEFVKHFAQIEGFEEKDVWELVEWWKLKNKWKRPLDKDVSKAWRMIRQKLNKKEKADGR